MKEGYDRVTDILAPFSGLSAVPEYILEQAKNRGKIVHEAYEAMSKDLGFPSSSQYSGYIQSLELWVKDKAFMPHPGRWYDEQLKITGECDGIYKDANGKLVLFDIKTPAKEGKTWELQGVAYVHLAINSGLYVDKLQFIRLPKVGGEAMIYEYHPQEAFKIFLECLNLYRMFFKGANKGVDLDF